MSFQIVDEGRFSFIDIRQLINEGRILDYSPFVMPKDLIDHVLNVDSY